MTSLTSNSLYEIDKAYLNALDSFTVDEETGEVFFNDEELQKLDGDFKNKADNIACFIKNLTALNESIKAEKASLDERLKENQSKIDKLKSCLAKSLELRDMKTLETARNKLSFRKSTSVGIIDEREVPTEFVKKVITEKIDKVAIKKALNAGNAVHGCFLIETNNLQIK